MGAIGSLAAMILIALFFHRPGSVDGPLAAGHAQPELQGQQASPGDVAVSGQMEKFKLGDTNSLAVKVLPGVDAYNYPESQVTAESSPNGTGSPDRSPTGKAMNDDLEKSVVADKAGSRGALNGGPGDMIADLEGKEVAGGEQIAGANAMQYRGTLDPGHAPAPNQPKQAAEFARKSDEELMATVERLALSPPTVLDVAYVDSANVTRRFQIALERNGIVLEKVAADNAGENSMLQTSEATKIIDGQQLPEQNNQALEFRGRNLTAPSSNSVPNVSVPNVYLVETTSAKMMSLVVELGQEANVTAYPLPETSGYFSSFQSAADAKNRRSQVAGEQPSPSMVATAEPESLGMNEVQPRAGVVQLGELAASDTGQDPSSARGDAGAGAGGGGLVELQMNDQAPIVGENNQTPGRAVGLDEANGEANQPQAAESDAGVVSKSDSKQTAIPGRSGEAEQSEDRTRIPFADGAADSTKLDSRVRIPSADMRKLEDRTAGDELMRMLQMRHDEQTTYRFLLLVRSVDSEVKPALAAQPAEQPPAADSAGAETGEGDR
jgi:hypothetical protein